MSGLGEAFRTAREAQGLSLADIAQRTHIRTAYLTAIEFEDWKTIGPPVYIRGFLRNYARCLGLDADDAVANFSGTPAGKAAPAPPPFNAAPRNAAPRNAAPRNASPRGETLAPPARTPIADAPKRGLSIGAIAGLIVALGLVAFVGYEYFDMKVSTTVAVGVPSAQPAAADASPAPAGAGTSAQPQAAPTELRAEVDVRASAQPASHDVPELTTSPFALRLGDSSWVRVTVDGKVAMLGTFPKGTVRAFSGRSATIRAGNAGGVDLWVDGKDLGPMGGLGDVAERSFRL